MRVRAFVSCQGDTVKVELRHVDPRLEFLYRMEVTTAVSELASSRFKKHSSSRFMKHSLCWPQSLFSRTRARMHQAAHCGAEFGAIKAAGAVRVEHLSVCECVSE